MVERQQQKRLDQLRLNGRGAYRDNRFPWENRGSLRNGPHIAGKAEVPETGQKFFRKQLPLPQIGNVFFRKVEVLQIADDLFQPRADGESAPVRHVPEKEVKIGDLVLFPGLKVSVAHGQFVEITEHGQVFLLIHCADTS